MKGEESLYTIEEFRKWESEKVRIQFTKEDVRDARILEVVSLGEKKNKTRIPFSVVLLTEMKEQYYTQGTFRVVLPENREEMMFIVPIGVDPDSGGMRYEVVYN